MELKIAHALCATLAVFTGVFGGDAASEVLQSRVRTGISRNFSFAPINTVHHTILSLSSSLCMSVPHHQDLTYHCPIKTPLSCPCAVQECFVSGHRAAPAQLRRQQQAQKHRQKDPLARGLSASAPLPRQRGQASGQGRKNHDEKGEGSTGWKLQGTARNKETAGGTLKAQWNFNFVSAVFAC